MQNDAKNKAQDYEGLCLRRGGEERGFEGPGGDSKVIVLLIIIS